MDLPDRLCRVPRLDSSVLPCLVSLSTLFAPIFTQTTQGHVPQFPAQHCMSLLPSAANRIGTHDVCSGEKVLNRL